MAKKDDNMEFYRNQGEILNDVYEILKVVGAEIKTKEKTNAKLIDSYDSLLTTYLDAEDDGF